MSRALSTFLILLLLLIAAAPVAADQPKATPPAEADAGRVAAEVDAGPRLDVPVHCVPGGAERADSVRAGLAAASGALADLAPAGAPRCVLVHDAARALTPPSVFGAVTAALGTGAVAAVPGLPLTDTVKQVTPVRGGVDVVAATPARAGLRAIQTPQGFDLDTLLAAHEAVRTDPMLDAAALTDDAMVMEAAGHEVVVVPGDPAAFKVTAPADLDLARLELALAETEALKTDLNKLLTYFDRLSELDTEGVEELSRPVVLSNVFREDTVRDGLGQQGAESVAVESENGFFRVPRTVEGGE